MTMTHLIMWLGFAMMILLMPTVDGQSDFTTSFTHPIDIAAVSENLLESAIWPKMETIKWPEETNMWHISKNPDAIYNYKIRDEMDRRVTVLQNKINEGKGMSDEEKRALGMKILHNYQEQRQMREMQRDLDKSELSDEEVQKVKEKLTNMVMEIKKEWPNPVNDPQNVSSSRSKRSATNSFASIQSANITRPDSSNSFQTTDENIIKKKDLPQEAFFSPLKDNITHSRLHEFHNTNTENQPSFNQTDGLKIDITDYHEIDREEIMKKMADNVAKAMEEKAERDLMDAMRRAGLKCITRVEEKHRRKSFGPEKTVRKRREINIQLDKSLVYAKSDEISSPTDATDEISVVARTLSDSLVGFFDEIPLTKTTYEFFVNGGFKKSMIKKRDLPTSPINVGVSN